MTLTVRLDPEEESKLKQIADLLNVENQSEAIRKMIHDTWAALQSNLTFVERRGGHPEVWFEGRPDLSERATRNALLNEYYEEKAARWRKGSKKSAGASPKTTKPKTTKPKTTKPKSRKKAV